MNNSGDAAEQIVRMSLESTEIILRLSGSAAKNVAAAIYSVLKNKDKNKIKGRQRLTSMLKSGKELKVFTVSEDHLKQFAKEAKRYGVVYCALRGKEKTDDGLVDVMVRAEDAAKINRIVERFKLATVDAASIKRNIEKTRDGKQKNTHLSEIKNSEHDEALFASGGKEDPHVPTKELSTEKSSIKMSPGAKKNEALSEPTFRKRENGGEDISNPKKQSVREQLAEIKSARKEQEEPRQRKAGRSKSENKSKTALTKQDNSVKLAVQDGVLHKQPYRKRRKMKGLGR